MIKSRRILRTGHVAREGEKRNAYRMLVGKPGGKRPLGRPGWTVLKCRSRMGRYGFDSSGSGYGPVGALVNTIMNLPVPKNTEKFLSGCIIGGFSRRAQLHD
jgi:hypothetical protein